MKCKIKMDVLEEKGQEVVNYANTELKGKLDELYHVFDDVEWRGNSKITYINRFRERINEMEKTVKMINFFGEFMKKASTDYTSANEDAFDECKKLLQEMMRLQNKLDDKQEQN